MNENVDEWKNNKDIESVRMKSIWKAGKKEERRLRE